MRHENRILRRLPLFRGQENYDPFLNIFPISKIVAINRVARTTLTFSEIVAVLVVIVNQLVECLLDLLVTCS